MSVVNSYKNKLLITFKYSIVINITIIIIVVVLIIILLLSYYFA